MERTKIIGIVVVAFLLIILAGIVLTPKISLLIAQLQARGSISKMQAGQNQCDGVHTICVMAGGKIVSKQVTKADTAYMQREFTTTKDQHIQYAQNVAAAVAAIRAYTHIPNLNVSLLKENAPIHISYYCSPDNKCWAVNNQTHHVIPDAK